MMRDEMNRRIWSLLCVVLMAVPCVSLSQVRRDTIIIGRDSASVMSRQNQELMARLEEYRALQEDLMAQRVVEKAQKQFTIWLTLGGIITLLAGFIGWKKLSDFIRDLVTKKLQTITKAQLEKSLLQEGHRQITEFVQNQERDLEDFAKKRIEQFVVATSPIGPTDTSALPAKTNKSGIDYSSQMPRVRDQGQEGSSVAFAIADALYFQILKQSKRKVLISTRYLYHKSRTINGQDPGVDGGAFVRDGIKVLSKLGAVSEEVWPYKPGDLKGEPPAAVDKAEHYKIKQSVRLTNVDQIRAGLQKYGPVICGITVYQGFMGKDVSETGIVPMPKKSETITGGHAVCIVGYDDKKATFKFRNSWGPAWGDHGYGYIPYKYAERFIDDSWAISM
jgi:C1A family cysteine protease